MIPRDEMIVWCCYCLVCAIKKSGFIGSVICCFTVVHQSMDKIWMIFFFPLFFSCFYFFFFFSLKKINNTLTTIMTAAMSSSVSNPMIRSMDLINTTPLSNTTTLDDSILFEKMNRECILFPTYAKRDPKGMIGLHI